MLACVRFIKAKEESACMLFSQHNESDFMQIAQFLANKGVKVKSYTENDPKLGKVKLYDIEM